MPSAPELWVQCQKVAGRKEVEVRLREKEIHRGRLPKRIGRWAGPASQEATYPLRGAWVAADGSMAAVRNNVAARLLLARDGRSAGSNHSGHDRVEMGLAPIVAFGWNWSKARNASAA